MKPATQESPEFLKYCEITSHEAKFWPHKNVREEGSFQDRQILNDHNVDWSAGWLVGWLVGQRVGWLVSGLVDWLVDWSAGWLVG